MHLFANREMLPVQRHRSAPGAITSKQTIRLSATPSKIGQVSSQESNSNRVRHCCQINDLLQDGSL
jgi:hypothetical protein